MAYPYRDTFRNSFWVAVKDLNHYGFDVAINNDSNTIRISRNINKKLDGIAIAHSDLIPIESNVAFTQKEAYIENRKLTAYQIELSYISRKSSERLIRMLNQ